MKVIHSPFELGLEKDSRVLMVMPHPDDEAIFSGGFLYELNKHAILNKLVTITKGDASTDRHGLTQDIDLALHRTNELHNALVILGGTPLSLYDIPDGKIPLNKNRVIAVIKMEIDKFKPSHLVTMEPDGIYGHPDHIALSSYVTQLCPKKIKLLYVTVAPHYTPRPESARMAKKSTIRPIAPEYEYPLPIFASVAKVRSLRAHGSQFRIDLFHWKTIIRLHRNALLWREYFTYAH